MILFSSPFFHFTSLRSSNIYEASMMLHVASVPPPLPSAATEATVVDLLDLEATVADLLDLAVAATDRDLSDRAAVDLSDLVAVTMNLPSGRPLVLPLLDLVFRILASSISLLSKLWQAYIKEKGIWVGRLNGGNGQWAA